MAIEDEMTANRYRSLSDLLENPNKKITHVVYNTGAYCTYKGLLIFKCHQVKSAENGYKKELCKSVKYRC